MSGPGFESLLYALSSCMIIGQLGAQYLIHKIRRLSRILSYSPHSPKGPHSVMIHVILEHLFSVRQRQANIKRNCLLSQDYLNWHSKPRVRETKKKREREKKRMLKRCWSISLVLSAHASFQKWDSSGEVASRDTSSDSVLIRVFIPLVTTHL